VAHAENSLRHAVGIERFERVVAFADADKLYRLASDLLDRKRGASTSVAVHLRQDHARDSDATMKFFSRTNRVLTRHRISNEKDLNRASLLLDVDQFFH